MSATITLPSLLRSRLAAIGRRARLIRTVRGAGLLVVVLGLSAAVAVLADCWLDLSPLTRQILFSTWLTVGAAGLLLGVFAPLLRRFDAAALAAVIEEKYPDLGERLTSAVELSGTSEEGHGSPVLIALLLQETTQRSAPLDFRSALPARRARLTAALAVLIALAVMVPAFVWPQVYQERAQRFFQPWNVPPSAPPYDIAVSPGDAVAAVGRPITLSARLTPRNEKAVLPETATLIAVDADGKETRHAMQRADNGDFTLAYKTPADVTYRVEAGEAVSDSYRLTAIAPVELAADSPCITVTPPAYARAVREEETLHGLVDLSPLQHSTIRFDFRFTRPAVAAYLEWNTAKQNGKDGKSNSADKSARQALNLSADRQAASFTMDAIKEGKYRLILEAEHCIRTELDGGTIRVQLDQPPSLVKFDGKQERRIVLPDERVPLEFEAADDIAVAGVELEYRVNEGVPVRKPLQLEGGNTPSAVARHVLDLAGKVQPDDRLSYRLRVTDNLPREFNGPHVVIYPADRWLTLQIGRPGDPRQQQEILAQRDDINRRLDAIRQALLQEKRGVYKVRQETRGQASLPPDQLDSVKQLQRDNRTSEKALRDVAEIAEVVPALQPIADRARDVADQEMRLSRQALEQVPRQTTPTQRKREFDKADEQLASAVKRLDELRQMNDRLAQERLDRARLEGLAEREKRLAEQAAELAATHPVLDPKARELAEKLKREQAETAQELERLAQQSEPLKEALEQARREQAKDLAERARELAQAQRDLARAETDTERQLQSDRLAELARRQQELAQKQEKLAQETRPSAAAAQTTPLKPEESQRAAEALKQGDAPRALRHQEQAAGDLERLAQAYERAVKVSADPKEAARQLEQAEKALHHRVGEEMTKADGKQPLRERLQPLREEQDAIRRAAQRLSVPPQHGEANKVKQQIGERAAQAAESLRKQDATRARAQMEEARNLLHRLSDLLPNFEQRRQQARREVGRVRRQQEEIARQVEQIKKDDPSAAQRLAEAARRQAEAAEALSKMDAPNQDARRERTTEALNRALADLLDGRREDLPASQQEAKRQLERLEQALRGEKPADERARELARKQRELAEEARAAASPSPQPLSPPGRGARGEGQEMQRKQRQIAEQTRNLPAPEAPQRQREAAEAAERAAQSAQAQPASPETRKRMEEASRKLDDLARQLAGEESDRERAERLARRQAEAAAEAEHQQGKPATPQAQRRQQEIAREASEVRGGDEARREKQRAQEALARAQQAPAQAQGKAQRQAADALRELADRLAGRDNAAAKAPSSEKPAEPSRSSSSSNPAMSPRQMAKQMAERQRQLARTTDKAAHNPSGKEAAQQAMHGIAAQQHELNRQASRLPANQAQRGLEQARAAMNKAEQALARNDAAKAQQKQNEAAKALERLVTQLPAKPSPLTPSDPQAAPRGLPSQEQSQQARQLARQQRELRDAVQRATQASRNERPVVSANPVKELARQQAEVAREAAQLARNVAAEQGEKASVSRQAQQARQAAQQAAQQVQAGALPQARQAGQQSAEQLRQLASQLARTPRGKAETPDTLEQARQLQRRQEDVNRRLQPLAGEARAQAAQQQEQQRHLQQETGELARQFQQLSQQARTAWPMQSALQRATGASRQAEQAMQQAQQQAQRGESTSQQQSEQRAAQSLDRAAQAAAEASRQSPQAAAKSGSQKSGSPKAGEAVSQAAQQMTAAQGQLSQGKPTQAQASMKQAAASLAQAAKQMVAQQQQRGQPGQPGQPIGLGRMPGGLPDLSAYGLDKSTYAGKSWGELPGELRTKIVQDMKARYGDDYARMIKYYFEKIAATKK
jgi:hypothetical protein